MSHQAADEVKFVADADEGSETDVESGQANDCNESASFLRASASDKSASEEHRPIGNQARNTCSRMLNIFHHALFPWAVNLILAIALVSGRFQGESSGSGTAKAHHTLAQDHIEYRTELMYDGVDGRNPVSEYQGWPTDEKDALWDYFNGAMVRIDRQEAEKLPHLSQRVALEKYKDDYVVGLTFTHAMHCLNALRKLYYPKRYNNSMFDKDGNVMYEYWWHTDHCIEIIRRYIACHADTTAFTYDWIKDTSILVHPGTVHTCKNFDRVDDWLKEHRVSVPLRKHVEGEQIVDYSERPEAPEWDSTRVIAPEDWSYTRDDM